MEEAYFDTYRLQFLYETDPDKEKHQSFTDWIINYMKENKSPA